MTRNVFVVAAVVTVVGCGSSDSEDPSVSDANGDPARPAPTETERTVFDPLVQSVERAKSVQQTIDEHAAEQRRLIEEAGQ